MCMGQQLIEQEEYVRRLRLCLFEVGFRDVKFTVHGWLETGIPWISTPGETVPVQLAYMASRLACHDLPVRAACYGCFRLSFLTQSNDAAARCRSGEECVTGGPAWPSHEELLGADRTEGLEIHANVA